MSERDQTALPRCVIFGEEQVGLATLLDLERCQQALAAGGDTARIVAVGLAWLAKLANKNDDYGSAVWQPSKLAPEAALATTIRVRMSDKVARIEALLRVGTDRRVKDETLDDTIGDLGAYCLLYLARPGADGK